MDELKAVVDDMKDDKVPGPDGFNANFIKVCWEIVHEDLHKMVTNLSDVKKLVEAQILLFYHLFPKRKM